MLGIIVVNMRREIGLNHVALNLSGITSHFFFHFMYFFIIAHKLHYHNQRIIFKKPFEYVFELAAI